jgi:CubicO group peptidase (beta-lactamase class C family)/D-alanyl-D-alanine dipeptidase
MRFFHSAALISACVVLNLLTWSCRQSTDSENVPPGAAYAAIAAHLHHLIEHEMADKGLPSVAIALVDGQDIVWAQGFGFEDTKRRGPATAATIYRVGSVSKLFTAMGIMRLVESGEIDLDAPVGEYLPDFQPNNPFSEAITLRQLMSHRSGLVREPPIGHYFDDTTPSLAQTAASLNATSLVYPPRSRGKYSNAGVAVAGYVLEKHAGAPFASYVESHLLKPMGLRHSSFESNARIRERLAHALMWTYDGREFPAPRFELGMAPAGNLYASALDMGRFLTVLFSGGRGPAGQILLPETLEMMWTPQFGGDFGLGFHCSELEGRRMLGHGGAVYGFATQLHFLPDERLGIAVMCALDGANDAMYRLATTALRAMLARKEGRDMPALFLPQALDSAQAHRLAGRYAHEGEALELEARDGQLRLWRHGMRDAVKRLGDTLIVDGRLRSGMSMLPQADGSLLVDGSRFQRAPTPPPLPPPSAWRGLIGEYGWDYNTLYILEKDQRLHALIEWFFLYPLEEVTGDTFAFPDYGLYHGEQLIFRRDDKDKATEAIAAGIAFRRRPTGLEEDATFAIQPLRPIETLRSEALAAQPPPQPDTLLSPDLVDLESLDSSIRLDIRYATTNNFMGAVFYARPKAFLQRPAAMALLGAHRRLREQGYGLIVYDAYRPWYVTKMFYDATPEDQKLFVADPAQGSVHNRGAAVDLGLYYLHTGRPAEMPSGYDEFTERAFPDYPGGTTLQRWHRELLRHALEAEDFRVYQWEWWHFDHRDARRYPVMNARFEELNISEANGVIKSAE